MGVATAAEGQAGPPTVATIPICPGLSIVTAIAEASGDYESIKTIEASGPTGLRLRYSSERTTFDLFDGTEKFGRTEVVRSVRAEDLASATSYLQQFGQRLPETVPGTTAIGTSAAVLSELKRAGKADFDAGLADRQLTPVRVLEPGPAQPVRRTRKPPSSRSRPQAATTVLGAFARSPRTRGFRTGRPGEFLPFPVTTWSNPPGWRRRAVAKKPSRRARASRAVFPCRSRVAVTGPSSGSNGSRDFPREAARRFGMPES